MDFERSGRNPRDTARISAMIGAFSSADGGKFDVGAAFENHGHSSFARVRRSSLFVSFSLDLTFPLYSNLMEPPSRTKDSPRADGEDTTRTKAKTDDWLVHCLVCSIRIFLVLFVAFARAIVLVAGDSIPDNLFDQRFLVEVPMDSTSSSESSNRRMDPLRGPETSVSVSSQVFYVIFVGRDVGYTTSR